MLDYHYANDNVLEAGIDEVGRGSLFGRLYVGAVVLPFDKSDIFDHGAELHQINDSKKLTKRKRAILYDYVKEIAVDWNTSYAEASEIDKLNVLEADLAAMRRCLKELVWEPKRILVDGDRWIKTAEDIPGAEYICIPKGDAKYLSIAGASILAKVDHDTWIEEVCSQNPTFDTHYGLLSNMGYGTATHMNGLKEHGITDYHRKSFRPVREAQGWIGEKD